MEVADGALRVEDYDAGRLEDVPGQATLPGAADRPEISAPRGGPEPLVPTDPLDSQGAIEVLVRIEQGREGKPLLHELSGLEIGAGGHGEGSGPHGHGQLPSIR
jgi:hypothetical protein